MPFPIQFNEDVTLANTALGLGETNPILKAGSIVEMPDRPTAEECLRIYGPRAKMLTPEEHKAATAPAAPPATEPEKGKGK